LLWRTAVRVGSLAKGSGLRLIIVWWGTKWLLLLLVLGEGTERLLREAGCTTKGLSAKGLLLRLSSCDSKNGGHFGLLDSGQGVVKAEEIDFSCLFRRRLLLLLSWLLLLLLRRRSGTVRRGSAKVAKSTGLLLLLLLLLLRLVRRRREVVKSCKWFGRCRRGAGRSWGCCNRLGGVEGIVKAVAGVNVETLDRRKIGVVVLSGKLSISVCLQRIDETRRGLRSDR